MNGSGRCWRSLRSERSAKYSGEGGRIQVHAQPDGDMVAIGVRDNGIGIAREALDSIFELFVQLDDSLSRSEGGLGIGLPLVRQLANLQGGTIVARSEGAGHGSEFLLRLPAVAAPARATERSPSPTAAPGRRRILLVDDNRDVVDILAELLARHGHDVRVGYDGVSAVRLARELRPEVAFLDIGLPGFDGYEVARQLREQLPGSLLVAVTGTGGQRT